MPTVTLRRSDLFPIGSTVGIYPRPARREAAPPTSAALATGTVDAAGLLTVTDPAILSYTPYVAYALVNGEHRYAQLRSTLDVFDYGSATGTATTSSGSTALTGVSAATGAFAIGQRIVGPGIPPGTYLASGSGASWQMTSPATASATVSVEAFGATPAVAGGAGQVGASLTPLASTKWRAKVMQRRAAIGTS